MERVLTFVIVAAPVLSGCTLLDDARLEGRLRRMARSAYIASPGACNGVLHSVDYAKGFEEGYYDVASGGNGCPPALPPKKYWSATYASPVGQEHVEAWFQGFRDGAAAARADGAATYGVIHVAAEHRVSHPPKPLDTLPLPPPPPTVSNLRTDVEPPPSASSSTPVNKTPATPTAIPASPPTTKPPMIETTSNELIRPKSPLPQPAPTSTTATVKHDTSDQNGWKKAAAAPAPTVMKVGFKQPAVDAASPASPLKTTSDDAGWKAATGRVLRLGQSEAQPFDF